MSDTITVSELRGLSANAIQALKRATHIVDGDEAVGILLPFRKPSPEQIAAISAEMDAIEAMRTPEVQAEFDAALQRWERE